MTRDEKGSAARHLRPESGEKTKRPEDGLPMLLRFVLKLAIIGLIVWLLLTFVLGVSVCHTNDMFPAVRDGDLLITLRLQQPEKGGIVAYRHDGRRAYGRVVATAGDVVDIGEEGGYTVNGAVPYETVFYETYRAEGGAVEYPYTVGEGEVFVLCDLRENLRDSRTFGAVSLKDTEGSLVLLLRRRGW